MFLAGMKVHEKSDRSDIPCSSEAVDQIVFFLPPAAFYAWAAQSLMTCEPSAARLIHRLGAVPLKQHFQTGHIRTRSRRRPQLLRQVCMALRALSWLGSNWSWYWARNSASKQVMTRARGTAGVDRVRVADADADVDADVI